MTIPYRLNIFGFLAHRALAAEAVEGVSGNYAFLDLIQGLKWVQKNIAAFGGDPDNVSIFGQSAGAGCVRAMCNSPLAKGLFKRAIIQSIGALNSTPFTSWCDTLSHAEQLGEDFFQFAGFKTLEDARTVSGEELENLFIRFNKEKRYPEDEEIYAGGYLRFGPIAQDGYVFPKSEAEITRAGEHADITYIVGSAADEYPYMTPCNIAFAENQINTHGNPVYVYYFQYVPPGAEAEGAHHSVEHHYVFQTLLRSRRPYGGFDFELSNELADRWAQFFRNGIPNCPEKPYAAWLPYTAENRKVLGITRQGCHMMSCPLSEADKARIKKELA